MCDIYVYNRNSTEKLLFSSGFSQIIIYHFRGEFQTLTININTGIDITYVDTEKEIISLTYVAFIMNVFVKK